MTSKFLLTGLAVLSATTISANATTIKPFVGATMGIQEAFYSDDAKDFERAAHIDLPTDFFTFGLEAGARFGEHSQIYNYGFSLNVDKTTYSEIRNKFSDNTSAKVDTISYSATFDNYIRLKEHKHIDLVLGVGLGTMAYHMDADNYIYDTTKYSFMPVLKAGLDFELTNNITLSAMTRIFIPTRSDYEVSTTLIIGGAVKYMF
ncbi:MAG: outer membrane beta-barrel protein [Alphaproteobacteria bacterium]|nr:outer membrane beta-barrel protein [Alphaproteobacteria bacterium]